MTERGRHPDAPPPDVRAAALARYLRQWADAFSLSADSTGSAPTAAAGMALLDAAALAEQLPGDGPGIRALSEAGFFESAPNGQSVFVETPEIRAAIQRPIVADPQDGAAILDLVVNAARSFGDPRAGGQP